MKALINIDYTYDVEADEWRLTCGEPGEGIEDYIVSLTEEFIKRKDYVVFAIDVHEENDPYHPETKLFPPHNIRFTAGRDLFGNLQNVYNRNKDEDHVLWIDKTRYSAFAGTDLDIKLRERGITELHLVGVCTDICVLHTAVDAYNKGYKIIVHKDGVASFNEAGHQWALGHFEQTLGADVL